MIVDSPLQMPDHAQPREEPGSIPRGHACGSVPIAMVGREPGGSGSRAEMESAVDCRRKVEAADGANEENPIRRKKAVESKMR